MGNEHYIERITAVINTINATPVRADQVDAVLNLKACTDVLKNVIAEMSKNQIEQKEE